MTSPTETVTAASTPGTVETAAWDLLVGIPVAAQIRAKIKKGERPSLGESLILVADLLWRVLVWTTKHLWKLTHWFAKELWKFSKESAKAVLKALGRQVYKAATLVFACAFFAFIGWELYAIYIQHDAWKPVRTLSSWVFTKHESEKPSPVVAATPLPTPVAAAPTMVPTVQAVVKPAHKHKSVASVPTPTVQKTAAVVQITPTVKPQGDLFTQGTDAVTKGANIAKAFGL